MVILSILDGIFIECLLLGVCVAKGKMNILATLVLPTKTKDYVVPIQKLKKERVSLQQRPGKVISPTVGLFA